MRFSNASTVLTSVSPGVSEYSGVKDKRVISASVVDVHADTTLTVPTVLTVVVVNEAFINAVSARELPGQRGGGSRRGRRVGLAMENGAFTLHNDRVTRSYCQRSRCQLQP